MAAVQIATFVMPGRPKAAEIPVTGRLRFLCHGGIPVNSNMEAVNDQLGRPLGHNLYICNVFLGVFKSTTWQAPANGVP